MASAAALGVAGQQVRQGPMEDCDGAEVTQVTVLCGFLGAGKTTTLSHVLQHACPVGQRVGVIANDVAAVDIDAQLVREVARASDGRATSVALDNGCACCTGSADLVSGLERLLSEDAARTAAGASPVPWITGIFPTMGGCDEKGINIGKDAVTLIQGAGGKVQSSVSGKTDFLVVGIHGRGRLPRRLVKYKYLRS